MKAIAKSPEWFQPIQQIEVSLADGDTVRQFADAMGFSKGVSGYAVHTMIMILFIWLRHRGDFSTIIGEAIACGGDTDSVAAIAGGISGAETESVHPEWVENLADRPYTIGYMTRLGSALAESAGGKPVSHLPWPTGRSFPATSSFF